MRAGRNGQSLLMVGLRGVGKTVLLNEIRRMAEGQGYAVALIEATEGRSLPELLVPPLRQVLFRLDARAGVSARVKRALRVLRSFIGAVRVKVASMEIDLDLEPERGTADSGDLEADLPALFVALGEAAADRGEAVALLIDELQYLDEVAVGALIMALHRVAQHRLPVVLVGAGLPQLVPLTGRAKSYAERLFTFPELGPLAPADAREALRGPVQAQGVDFTDLALEEVVRLTRGYPYFLQEWGYEAWNAAATSPIDADTIDACTAQVIRKLDGSFFRVRFDRLTPREKHYLRALAALGPGPQRSGEVAALLGVRVQSVAPLRSGLIRKGMIYSPAHGDTAFTVPLFEGFLERTMPAWRPRAPRGAP